MYLCIQYSQCTFAIEINNLPLTNTKTMLKRSLLFLFLSLQCLVAEAQFTEYIAQKYAFTHLWKADTVWVGTENGVFKMLRNGKILGQYPKSGASLTGFDEIKDMCFDAQGHLLVNRGYSGIDRLEGKKWTRITTENTFLVGNKNFTNIEVDSEGHIWLSGKEAGIYKFDGQNWVAIASPFTIQPDEGAYKLGIAPDGAIWGTFTGGIARYENNTWVTSASVLPTSQIYLGLTWSNSGDLYATSYTPNAETFVWKLPNSDFSNTPFMVTNTTFLGATQDGYSTIAVDNTNQIWLGAKAIGFPPLLRFDGVNWTQFGNGNSPLHSVRVVQEMNIDANGALWVSTGDALPLVSYKNGAWEVFSAGFAGMSSASAVDYEGKIWFAGSPFIENYDPQTGDFKHYFPQVAQGSNDPFYDMTVASDSTIWACSRYGLWHFDGVSWTQYLPTIQISKIVVEENGMVWFVTFEFSSFLRKLYRFNPSNGQVQLLDGSNSPFNDWMVFEMEIAPDGAIWIVNILGGLVRYKEGVFTEIDISELGILDQDLGRMSFGLDGKLWLTVGNLGLVNYDGTDWMIYTPFNSGLLFSDQYVSMVVDASNVVWISFNDNNGDRVLQRFTGNTWTNYTNKNSNLNDVINTMVAAPDGTIWLHDQSNIFSFKSLPRWLRGNVLLDENNNCQTENTEMPLNQWIVQATDEEGKAFYAKTYSNGAYEINLDSNQYQVSLFAPSPSWGNCDADLATDLRVNLIDTIDFSGEILAECPLLQLDISVPFLRRCFNNTYQVNWCNIGTSAAESAYVRLILPDELMVQNMTLPFTSPTNGVYFVQIGDVPMGDCGSFAMTVLVDCDAVFGATLCVSAKIFPDSICLPAPNWSGADLEASATCTSDSVYFKLKNKGNGNMNQALEYIAIEDEVIMRTAPVQIPAGDSTIVVIPVISGYQRIQIPQELGHPFPGLVSASVEGCNGQNNLSYFLQYPFNDASPFSEREYAEVIGSFDPNDKAATPQGVKDEHFILPKTPIEYKIRFQNTGTDTAFTVVVRDTLSPWLDIESFRIGASSHANTWDISGNGVLTFTFENILLPDSNVNQAASNGFLSFTIQPLDTTTLGTLIENRAGIFFDFNEAVLTNTVWHTVDTGFLVRNVPLKVEEKKPVSMLSIFPTPANELVHIGFRNLKGFGNLRLRLYDVYGKSVLEQKMQGKSAEILRNGLTSGVYFLEIWDGERVIEVKKVVFL
jgi:uncharacterized repeat protein (TIGR01451 family)